MTDFDQQWLAALALVVTVLFVAAGLPIAEQWHRRFRNAAIGVFVLALVVVTVKIALWLFAGGGR